MKYEQEIDRDIELEAEDLVDLFRHRKVEDDGAVVRISNFEFLKAIGRLDPLAQLTDEEREELIEKHGTPSDMLRIKSEEMENDLTPEERDS